MITNTTNDGAIYYILYVDFYVFSYESYFCLLTYPAFVCPLNIEQGQFCLFLHGMGPKGHKVRFWICFS